MGIHGPQQAFRSGEVEPEPQAIQHLSHAHVLRRTVVPVGAAVCDGCFHSCSGVAYLCHPCDYLLHKSCATAPPTLRHQGHAHALVFAEAPPYPEGRFGCNACGKVGKGFCFRCSACKFDLHIHCAAASPRQGSTAASTERALGQTSSSSAGGSWGSGLQMGANVLQGGAAVASMTHHGLEISRMLSDDQSAADVASDSGGGFLSFLSDFFSS